MAIKQSGSLSFQSDIRAEFGGTKPHSMSEYYRGGSLVRSTLSTIGKGTASSLTTITGGAGLSAPQYPSFRSFLRPEINGSNYFYRHEFWDNGSAVQGEREYEPQVLTTEFTLDQGGSYRITLGGFNSNPDKLCTISLNGDNLAVLSSGAFNTVENLSHDFNIPAAGVIRLTCTMFNVADGDSASHSVDVQSTIGGELAGRTRELASEINTGIPVSDTISFSDFYGARLYEREEIEISGYRTTAVPVSGGQWSDQEFATIDTFDNPLPESAGDVRITFPEVNILIRGDEQEKEYDGDDNDGIRNPGFLLQAKNASGNWVDLMETKGTGSHNHDDNAGLNVAVPSASVKFSSAVYREFRIRAIAQTYDGGAGHYIIYDSDAFTIEVETA